MARRKPAVSKSATKTRVPAQDDACPNGDASNNDSKSVDVSGVKQALPVLAVAHLIAVAFSYLAIVEPSSIHTSILASSAPYLRSTHFAADGRRYYMAHGTPDEQPHRLQYATLDDQQAIDSNTNWETVKPSGIPGLASSDRYQRWMILTATLAESDQPSLAAALLLPLVKQDDSIDVIRVIRLPTELTTAADDSAPPPYVARVVRDENQTRIVSIQSPRLTTSRRLKDDSTKEAGDE